MEDRLRRPTGAAVAAALSPLLAVPLSLLLLRLRVGGSGEGLGSTWVEGGVGMYLVLLSELALALVAAALMYFGVHRGSPVVVANAPLASALAAVGALGFWLGVDAVLDAIVHAHPMDRTVILAAGTAEALSASLFGLCAMAALLLALCAGLVLGILAQEGTPRRLLLATTGVFGALAAVAWASAGRVDVLMSGLKAITTVSAGQRQGLLVGLGEELASARTSLLLTVVAVVVLSIVGAALVRSTPALAVAVPLLGLGGLFGLGVQAVAERGLREGRGAGLPASKPLGLLAFEGHEGIAPRWCARSSGLVDCDTEARAVDPAMLREVLASLATDDEKDLVTLGVSPGAESRTVWAFLAAAAGARVGGVVLVGEFSPRAMKLPAELEFLRSNLTASFRMVPVALSTGASGCGERCVRASVQGESLVVGSETWSAAPLGPASPGTELQVSIDSDLSVSPETLVKLAMAAARHERRSWCRSRRPPCPAWTCGGRCSTRATFSTSSRTWHLPSMSQEPTTLQAA